MRQLKINFAILCSIDGVMFVIHWASLTAFLYISRCVPFPSSTTSVLTNTVTLGHGYLFLAIKAMKYIVNLLVQVETF